MSQPLKASQLQLYRIINEFVRDRNIQLSQFWYSERICVTLENLIEMINIIGLQITEQLNNNLSKDQVELISLQNLINNVQFWRNSQKNVSLYITKNSPIREQVKLQKTSPSIGSKSRISSNSNFYVTKKYLNQHSKKQISDKIKLSNTLRSVVNQSNYELSLKIGQANDICSKLKNGITYMIQLKNNSTTEITRNQRGKQQKISEKQFETQYKDLKIKIINKPQEIQGTLEEDLKKVLVQVMCLSNDMKQQIKLLEKKGISH